MAQIMEAKILKPRLTQRGEPSMIGNVALDWLTPKGKTELSVLAYPRTAGPGSAAETWAQSLSEG